MNAPNYLEDDTFSLVMNGVGGLLLPIPDQDGDGNTIDYHFAEERFWRVRQYLIEGDVAGYDDSDIGYWVVWDPSGMQYYFGNYSDGNTNWHAWYPSYEYDVCQYITMQTWRWSLTRVRNIFGKELTYNYNIESAPSPKFMEGCSSYAANMAVAVYPDSIVYPNNRYRVVFVRENDGSGKGYRTDYDQAWNDAQSTMLYMRAKLLRIEVWQDPNGTWNSGDEVLIRKYVLGYGGSGQQIYPALTWPAGGKTPTLTSITEYGLYGTNPLPATEFTYDASDDMHLDYGTNGYGGEAEFNYSAWNANDAMEYFLFTVDGGYTYSTGEFYPDAITPYGDDLDWLKELFQPGGAYKIVAHVWPTVGGSWVKLGLDDGTTHIYGSQTNLVWGQWNTVTSIVSINGSASQTQRCSTAMAAANLTTTRFTAGGALPVSSRTLTDEVTGSSYVYQYAYNGAAVNDTLTSVYVQNNPDGYYLMTKPYSEFRGHYYVTETGPDGSVVVTYFAQDDIYKGQVTNKRVNDIYGNNYTNLYSYFSNQETTTGALLHPQGQPTDFYHDLEIFWTYTTYEKEYIYNKDASYILSRIDYQYNASDQGGTQYGNRTRTISYYWNGSAWVAYRGTRGEYFPQVTNGASETSRYLTGLPAYTNAYKCPGGCDWEVGDLLSSHIYLQIQTRFLLPSTNCTEEKEYSPIGYISAVLRRHCLCLRCVGQPHPR
jgi:hypothetical protein